MGLNDPQRSSTILLLAILFSESYGGSRGTSNFSLFAGSSSASSLCAAMHESLQSSDINLAYGKLHKLLIELKPYAIIK